ncbi:hypothetical protein [Glycomyces rhizosphaerae]|uniref:Uncharacterized protein n=1 Tax=Glycomyces rhizosphaerae TaxID=2054422 RepID=A0ABV7Q224_9ACTN
MPPPPDREPQCAAGFTGVFGAITLVLVLRGRKAGPAAPQPVQPGQYAPQPGPPQQAQYPQQPGHPQQQGFPPHQAAPPQQQPQQQAPPPQHY